MKKLIYGTAIATLLLTACKKDFITLPPVSTVSVDNLYKTDKDFQDAIIGCYSVFRTQYQNHWLFGDLRSDDSKQEVFGNLPLLTFDNFTLTNDAVLLKDTWGNYYKIINRANTILAKIADASSSTIPNKDRYIGETKFLRALAYFDIVRIFGDVPLVTNVITIGDGYKAGREKTDRIYDEVIIKDLLDAETRLPLKYTGTDLGRATRGAAKALLGKVYLTRKDFTKAEAKLQEVTTLGYSLLQNYNSLFDYSRDEHHTEYIFDIEYEEGLSIGNSITNTFIPNSVQMAAFYKVTGARGEANSPTDGLIASFEAQDARKDISVGTKGGYRDANNNFITLLPTTSQTYTKKYLTPVASGNDSRVNWKVIRYADVLLMYSESLNENGKTSEALTYLNQIRTRAGLLIYSNLSKDETREKIYLERRLELAFEGHRWFDLVRTGRAFTLMQSFGMKAHMTVFPIPLSQVQLINDPNIFPQNAGYN